MDSDKIGLLIKFMNITNKFNQTQYNDLLFQMSQNLTTPFMKKLIFYGFYSLLTITKNESNTNINALNNAIQIAMKKQNHSHSSFSNNEIQINQNALKLKQLQSLNIESLQQLCINRNFSINDIENKYELIDKLQHHLTDCHAVKSFKYHKLSLKQLKFECFLFNTKYDSSSISQTLSLLFHQICKLYPIHLLQIPSSILCFICTYLDISSLLRFEGCNRTICINVRKPHSCIGLRYHEYTKYIQYHYDTKYKKYNILPDLYRFCQSNSFFISPKDPRNLRILDKYDDTMNDKLLNLCQNKINHLYVSCLSEHRPIVYLPNLRNIRLTDIGSIKYTNMLMDKLLIHYNNEKYLKLNVFSVRNMDFILYEEEMKDNIISIYRFIAFILPQFWKYHTIDTFEKTAKLLDSKHISKCLKYNVLELIGIDDGECDTMTYNDLLELFNDKYAIQCILKQQLKGFISFGSHNNSLCNALSNTIINQLSEQLYSLHLWSEEDDFSFLINNDIVEDEKSCFYNLSELCMELISDNSFDLLQEIGQSAKLRQVHFEVNMESVWFDECELFIQSISKQLFVYKSLNWIEIEMNDTANDITNVYDVFNHTLNVKEDNDKLQCLVIKIEALVNDDQFNSNLEHHSKQIMELFNNMRECYNDCMLLLKFEFNMYRYLMLTHNLPNYHEFMTFIGDCFENDMDVVYNSNNFQDKKNHSMSISIALSTKNCRIDGYHTEWMCQCDKCFANPWFDGY